MNGDLYYLAAIAGKPLPCAKPARRDTAGGGAGVLRARNVMLIVRPAMDRSDPSSQADPATADGPLAGPLAGPIGRASCRDRVGQSVLISVVAGIFKKKLKTLIINTYTR